MPTSNRKAEREKHFRSVVFALECGHEGYAPTSMYRIDHRRLGCIIGSLARSGVWCQECNKNCRPARYVGTARTDEAFRPRTAKKGK